MNKSILSVVCLIGSLVITYYFIGHESDQGVKGAFEIPGVPDYFSSVIQVIVGFVTMIFGVLLGSIYRYLLEKKKTRKKGIPWIKLIKTNIQSLDFQIAIVGAPIVFGLLWEGISNLGVAQFVVISLQNGFAIHAILGRIVNPEDEVA